MAGHSKAAAIMMYQVPGLVYKLAPMDEKMRKLNNVRKLWEGILEISEVKASSFFIHSPYHFKRRL